MRVIERTNHALNKDTYVAVNSWLYTFIVLVTTNKSDPIRDSCCELVMDTIKST